MSTPESPFPNICYNSLHMTTVVTGAAGHIGNNLVRALIERQRPVRALVYRHTRSLEGLGVEAVRGDVRDLDSLLAAFKGADTVYHLAADISLLSGGWLMLSAVNVTGTQNVIEACFRSGVRRLVHFSSIHAVEPNDHDACIDESSPMVGWQPCPPYDRSKAAGEEAVYQGIQRGLDAIIIRPTAVVGPHDYQPSHLGTAILAIARGKLPALVPGGYDWVDVRDVVQGALSAEEKARTGERYMLSGHWVSLRDLAAMVGKYHRVRVPRLVCPMALARLGAPFATALDRMYGRRPLYTTVSLRALRGHRNISHEKATRELGYQPRPFERTVADTLDWFEASGQLAPRKREGQIA
jgi:dihydroflavonol-4-reductase